MKGSAEVFGTEMAKGKVYTITTHSKIAVFTYFGCSVKISSFTDLLLKYVQLYMLLRRLVSLGQYCSGTSLNWIPENVMFVCFTPPQFRTPMNRTFSSYVPRVARIMVAFHCITVCRSMYA